MIMYIDGLYSGFMVFYVQMDILYSNKLLYAKKHMQEWRGAAFEEKAVE